MNMYGDDDGDGFAEHGNKDRARRHESSGMKWGRQIAMRGAG